MRLLADSDEFTGKGAGLEGGLFGLGGVAGAAFGGGEDVLAGLLIKILELENVALEFSGICSD